jgi:hypothetical protein
LLNNIRFKKNIIDNFLAYALSMLFIFSYFNVYLGYNSPINNYNSNLFQLIVILIGTLSIFKVFGRGGLILNRYVLFLISITVFFVAFFVINKFNYGFPSELFFLYFIDPICLVVYFICQFYSKNMNKIFYAFENIMIIISIFSLIGWMLFNLKITPNSYVTYTWAGVTTSPGYFHVSFFSQGSTPYLFWNDFVRNTGLFTEAPMYAYLLSVAFLIELFLNNSSKNTKHLNVNWKLILLFITMFTTSSSSGMVIVLLSVFYKLLLTSKRYIWRFMVLIFTPIFYFLMKVILSTKTSDVNIHSSYGVRINDAYSAFMAWKNHIFIGNGFYNYASISKYMYAYRIYDNNDYSSNGILCILAYGGIVAAMFYIVPLVLSFKVSLKLFGFFAFYLSLLYFEPLQTTPLSITIVSYVVANILLKLGKDE